MTGPGTTIADRYNVIGHLGTGAMGSVWLARDTALHRDVAVKSVRGPLVEGETGSTEGEARAMREARMIARINHPNAVAIYDLAIHEGRPWLVMEYVPARDLAQLVRDRGALPARRVAELGGQVAAALADAHRAGIVHRDVKPANVLISEAGAAKITDFGIARGDDEVTLTAAGEMWGTPAYFAPEVAKGATPTAKADVWSLGATLYYAVEGAPPYGTDASPLVLLGRIANQPVPPPERAGVLGPLLIWLLERDPDDRPTMSEAARRLSHVGLTADLATDEDAEHGSAGDDPAAPVPAGPGTVSFFDGDREDDETTVATPYPDRQEDRRRRPALLPLLLAAVAVVALVGVGALAWALLGGGGADDRPAAGDGDRTQSSQGQAPPPSPDQSAAQSPDPPQGSTKAPKQEPSSTPAEAPPSPRAERTERGPDRPPRDDPFSPGTMRRTVTDYYALMPDDTEEGFALLGPGLRAQGFESYDSFWDSIDSVSVSGVRADPDNRSVTATVAFVTEEGETSTESHRFGLVPDGSGGLLIDTDEPL